MVDKGKKEERQALLQFKNLIEAGRQLLVLDYYF